MLDAFLYEALATSFRVMLIVLCLSVATAAVLFVWQLWKEWTP